MFVNTLTAYDKYFVFNRDLVKKPIQMELSKKEKAFSHFFFAFLKSRSILNVFKKMMTIIAYVFSKLQTG